MSRFTSPLSVVIPMYNEAENVIPFIQEVADALTDLVPYEIIVVDDGSTDNTHALLLQLQQQQQPALKIVQHRNNYGQSAGVITGVRAAQYDLIVTLDGDGQNDPQDIKNFLSIGSENKQQSHLLLIGDRTQHRSDTPLRKYSSAIANFVRSSLLKDNCPDSGCGIKLFSREIFLQLPHFKNMHRFIPALFKRAGGIVMNVPVNHRPRLRGYSKYGVMNRLWVGIIDLFGVAWLLRRPISFNYDKK